MHDLICTNEAAQSQTIPHFQYFNISLFNSSSVVLFARYVIPTLCHTICYRQIVQTSVIHLMMLKLEVCAFDVY